jgi:hypothetical protein
MFESGSNLIGLHMEKVKFSRLNSFQDFKVGKIAMFLLDSIMYEGMELTFNQENQAL